MKHPQVPVGAIVQAAGARPHDVVSESVTTALTSAIANPA
jgi:hypothetical protein